MKYCYQIYTGAQKGRGIKLNDILDKLPDPKYVDKLIIGWSKTPELYKEVRKYTKDNGIQMILWLPVFSEHSDDFEIKKQIRISSGEEFESRLFDGDEKFDFSCPSDNQFLNKLIKFYDDEFSDIGFDGVFLDRIRYPSATMGFESLFGCQCKECLSWFKNRGLEKAEIESVYQDIRMLTKNKDCLNPLRIVRYENGSYEYKNDTLSRILKLKRERMTLAIIDVAKAFKERGLIVGMDFFAPFLSEFVGQDYYELAKHADFVKPMLYRYTYTPSGMHFEIDAIAKSISNNDKTLYKRRRMTMHKMLGIDDGDESLFKKDLDYIRKVENDLNKEGLFIPGIEVQTVKGLPPVTNNKIKNNVKTLEENGFINRVACWDIASASKDAIDTFVNKRKEKDNE